MKKIAMANIFCNCLAESEKNSSGRPLYFVGVVFNEGY